MITVQHPLRRPALFPRTASVSVPSSSFFRPPNSGCRPLGRKRADLIYRIGAAYQLHRRHVAGTVNPALFNIYRFAYSGWLNGAAFKSALVGIKPMYDTSATWQRLPARACDVDDL